MIYYLDTSIWIDFYEKRGKNGEYALRFILKRLENDEAVLYSDLHIKELKNIGYTIDQINDLFKITKPHNIRRVHMHKEQLVEARRLIVKRKIPIKDALHAVLARDNYALMISRDRHFEKLNDVVETRKPEEIY